MCPKNNNSFVNSPAKHIPAADADVDVFHHLVHVTPLIATILAELRRIALLLTHSIALPSLPASRADQFRRRHCEHRRQCVAPPRALVPLKVNSQFCLYAKTQLALADDVVDVE